MQTMGPEDKGRIEIIRPDGHIERPAPEAPVYAYGRWAIGERSAVAQRTAARQDRRARRRGPAPRGRLVDLLC